ncbi:hypothetical protein N836_36440 [Leptolyngbya sp. Heron Island J]|nr:hypothetical protein N836_36440 [Leptolyngbya sp. Heron Island J]
MSELSKYRHSEEFSSMHECPKCGKHTLLQMSTKFKCIWCDFYRDLAQPNKVKPPGFSSGDFIFFVIVAIVLLMIF